MMYGVYGCYDDTDSLVYVGSSRVSIEHLSYNHRNFYKFPDGKTSKFREALVSKGKKWKFKWLETPRKISKIQCEIEEGALIRAAEPLYNVDMFPYETSVTRGRLDQI